MYIYVAGICKGRPTAFVTMTNPENTNEFADTVQATPEVPRILALHPANMEFIRCQEILRSKMPATVNLSPNQMLSACTQAIHEMCRHTVLAVP